MSDDLLDDATFAEEFPQVEDQIYLDHAGTTLFAKSQISKLQDDLFPSGGKILGNPHSHNPSSRYSADLVEQVRLRILQFFNATPEDYDVIFTSGATAAIKVVVEAFDFASSSPCQRTDQETSGAFVYTQENHTSVFGARGVAFARGASVFCVDADDLLSTTALLISSSCSSNLDDENGTAGREISVQERCGNGLFAYPAQCNFSGRKFPLEWSSEIKNGGNQLLSKLESLLTGSNQLISCTREGEGIDTCRSSAQHNQQPSSTQHLPKEWFVLLDAASYAATNPLDLSKWSPDFVCVSFYKIFGFPTGVGALLVRKSSAERVLTRKQYFGGGTVAVSLTRSNFVKFRPELHERLEDGTIPFLSIISLLRGFDTLTRLAGNMSRIQNHVSSLVQSAYKGLSQLRHRDGSAVVELYYGGSAVASPSSSCSASAAAGASNATNTAAYSDEGLASGLGRINKNAHDSSHAGSSGDDIDSASSKSTNGTTADHGSALAFSVLMPGGAYVGFSEVSKMLELFDIHVRTGCFCNPGACQKWLRMSDERILGNHQAGHVCGDNVDLVDGQPTGCIRISFGYMSRHRDVDRFLKAMQECFVDSSITAAAAASSGDANNTQQIDKDPTTSAARPPPPQLGSTGRHQCHVTDLLVYPVKSCGAFRPAARRWPVTDSGFAFDRTWMITDGRGVVLSQKRESRLCFVMPRVDLEAGLLWLHVDGLEDISVPLIPTGVDDPKLGRSASICTSKVCGDRVDVLDCGDAVSEWLSDALCRDDNPRLLRINPDFQRLARKAQAGTKLSLANEAQFLLISRASVRALMEDLSARHCKKEDAASDAMSEVHNNITGDGLDEEELISRFRPNIVIDGSLDPYEEEEAENFFFLPSQENGSSPVTLQNTGPCSRCQMVCIDQQTGEKTKEPLVTLAATRGPKIPFGVHCRFKLPDESDEKNTNVCPLKDTWLEILSSVTFNTKYKAQI